MYKLNCNDFKKVDSWALGVLLFNLITGQMPFKANTKETMMKRVTNMKKEPKFN